MSDLVMIYEGPDACQQCLGWKRVANDDERSSWKHWAELPAPENIAVRLGLVYPVECPRCQGSGRERADEAQAFDLQGAAIKRLETENAELRAEIERLLALSAAEHDATKALLIRLRIYFVRNSWMTGEIVAWDRLKKRYSVGQSSNEADEAWLAAYDGPEGGMR